MTEQAGGRLRLDGQGAKVIWKDAVKMRSATEAISPRKVKKCKIEALKEVAYEGA